MTARQLAARYGIQIGCIDNSCMFGAPGGMATNGGCRCPGARFRWAKNVSQGELDDMRTLIRQLAHVMRVVAECTPEERT